MRARPLLLLVFALGAPTLGAQSVGPCPPARTALVLGGGGAKGMAHLGLLQALDSLGVTPDLVVGSSAGAVIGALWASGESAASITTRLRAARLERLVQPYAPTLGAPFDALPPAVVWERGTHRWVLQDGAVRDEDVERVLTALAARADRLAGGDFDALPIPFRAVATDLVTREVVPLGGGSLVQALRASMAIPVLLHPVRLGPRALVDGGLGSNNPVAIARALGAERVIVSTIASPRPDAATFDDPLAVAGAVFEFLWVQDSLRLGATDLLVAHPTAPYGMLDFRPATFDTLVALGRRTADAALGQATCLRPLGDGRRRIGVPVPMPPLRIGRPTRPDRSRLGLGVAFDHTLSGQLSLTALAPNLAGSGVEGSADATIGTWRGDLRLAARRVRPTVGTLPPLGLRLDLTTESVRRFDGQEERPPAHTDAASVFVGVLPLMESGWTPMLGVMARTWRQPGQAFTSSAGLVAALTLRHPREPTPGFLSELMVLASWRRSRVEATLPFALGPATLIPRLRLGAGHTLALAEQFTLGGPDGFAGMPLLAGRGDHEAFASLAVRWPLRPRLSARVEPMVGRIGLGGLTVGPDPLHGRTHVGGRVGIAVETPLGELRVEEGFGERGRRAAFIRFGAWR
jgi:predicted acylesterase/phospholipase RssA